MKLTTEDIEIIINEHRVSLETFTEYREMLQDDTSETIADVIENANWEGEEVNLGFEQGYLAALNMLLEESKETITI